MFGIVFFNLETYFNVFSIPTPQYLGIIDYDTIIYEFGHKIEEATENLKSHLEAKRACFLVS